MRILRHWNHIAIFTGATSKFEQEGTHFTLGLDYIRKLPPSGRWSISIFAEAIFEEHTEWLFGIPVFYRPYQNLWVRTGPGFEILQKEEHDHGDAKTETKIEFLWRAWVMISKLGNIVFPPVSILILGAVTRQRCGDLISGMDFRENRTRLPGGAS